ncbi:hypothetical protein, partial [Salmonella sp. s39606]|uniref:hypothetical protein n=1 Tax=Salmonella sp. s39606 TaxID=3159643 RepID=UPI0039804C17
PYPQTTTGNLQHNLASAKSPARSQRVTPIEGRKRPTGLRNVDEEGGEGGIRWYSRRNGKPNRTQFGRPESDAKAKKKQTTKKKGQENNPLFRCEGQKRSKPPKKRKRNNPLFSSRPRAQP